MVCTVTIELIVAARTSLIARLRIRPRLLGFVVCLSLCIREVLDFLFVKLFGFNWSGIFLYLITPDLYFSKHLATFRLTGHYHLSVEVTSTCRVLS